MNARFHGTAAAVLAFAIVAERAPAQWLAVYLDRVSAIHLLVALGLLAFWWLAAPAVEDRTTATRLGTAVLSGGALAAIIAALDPRFFLGPYASLDPTLAGIWLPRISEVREETLAAAPIVMHFGAPAVALLAAVVLLRKPDHRAARAALLLPLAATTVIGFFQLRWLLYAEAFGAALLGAAISNVAASIHASRLRAWARGALVVCSIFGSIFAGTVLGRTRTPSLHTSTGCSDREAVTALHGLRPSVIATHVDLGPAILYHTPHSVLAAPYLHNSGNRVVIATLDATLDEADPRDFRERGVDVVLVCPAGRDAYLVPERDGRETLYGALIRGRAPSWLVPIPGSTEADVRLYRLEGSRHPVALRAARVSRGRTERVSRPPPVRAENTARPPRTAPASPDLSGEQGLPLSLRSRILDPADHG